MEEIEENNLRKLTPEERLKRLKALEERRKKEQEEVEREIKQMQGLIKESEKEIEHIRVKEEELPVLGEEEGVSLEEAVGGEPVEGKEPEHPMYGPIKEEDIRGPGYSGFKDMSTGQIGENIGYLTHQAHERGYVNRREYEQAGAAYKELKEREEWYAQKGMLSEEREDQIKKEKDLLGKVISAYKGHEPF